jgi:hypothetical protein
MIPPIPGAERVAAWFGEWPTFQDAEILSVLVNRDTTSLIRIHTWIPSLRTDWRGRAVRAREAIVVFEFAAMSSLHIEEDASPTRDPRQGLSVEQTETGFHLRFVPGHGLGGDVIAQQLAVRLEGGL